MVAARRRRFWVFAILGCIVLALIGWAIFHKKPQKAAPPPPIPVTAVRAASRDLPISVSALGAAQAWTSDTIFAQVSGKLIRVNFAEGSEVHAGQLLAEVDPGALSGGARRRRRARCKRDQAIAGRRAARFHSATRISKRSIRSPARRSRIRTGHRGAGSGHGSARQGHRRCRARQSATGAGSSRPSPGARVCASSTSGQHRQRQRLDREHARARRPQRARASATSSTGSGIVVINQIQPIAVTFTVPEGDFQRIARSVRTVSRKPLRGRRPIARKTGTSAGHGRTAHRRQQGRSRDRHGRTQGALRPTTSKHALAGSVRRREARDTEHPQRHDHPDRRGQSRAQGYVRVRRRSGRQGGDASDRHRRHRRHR